MITMLLAIIAIVLSLILYVIVFYIWLNKTMPIETSALITPSNPTAFLIAMIIYPMQKRPRRA